MARVCVIFFQWSFQTLYIHEYNDVYVGLDETKF